MNVINYLRHLPDGFELFEQTFESGLRSLHFDVPSWEAGTIYIIMDKKQFETLEKALVFSVLHHFRKFGDYAFGHTPKQAIYTQCVEHLDDHYGENTFGISEIITLKDVLNRLQHTTGRRIYRNEEWNNPVQLQPADMEWANENPIRTHHLKSEWNDEDYLFETPNYFIRFNWYTSA